jgi:hypothetical protein
MPGFLARDKSKISDGETATLDLAYDTDIVTATGVVRAFKDENGETRWEISTDDPQHPAIGFLPQNVLTKTG